MAVISSLPVLLVADFLHPANSLAIEQLLDGDVSHRRRRRSAMPVFQSRRKPHHVAWADLFDRPALALYPAESRRHNQRLTKRMRVPRRARAGLERDLRGADTGRLGSLK